MKYIKEYELFGGAKITSSLKNDIFFSENKWNDLMISIYQGGDTKEFKKLLDLNTDLEYEDLNGNTALLIATRYANLKMIQEIIKKGANINHKNNKNQDFYDISQIISKTPRPNNLLLSRNKIKKWIEKNYPEFIEAKKYNL